MIKENTGTKKALIFIVIIAFFIVINDKIIVLFPTHNQFFNFNISQWGVNYENGFVFRGFIGTVLDVFNIRFTDCFVYYSIAANIIIFIMCVYALLRVYKISPHISTIIFLIFLISMPSNIRWWKSAGMFGSMDTFICIIALGLIYCIVKTKKTTVVIVISLIVSIVATLINEYFVFIYMPLIFSLMVYKHLKTRSKFPIKPVFMYLLPMIIAGVMVFAYGTTPVGPMALNDDIRQRLMLSFKVADCYNLAYDHLYYFNFAQKFQNAMRPLNVKEAIKLIMTLAVLSPSILVFVKLFARGLKEAPNKKLKKSMILVMASTLTPILGVFLLDFYYMWIGYVIITASVSVTALIFLDGEFKKAAFDYIKKKYILIGAIGLMNICLGAFYTLYSYEWLEFIFKQLG